MLTLRETIDAADTAARLNGLQAIVRREADGLEANSIDDAVLVALHGAVDALKAEVGVLVEVERLLEKAVRKVHGPTAD